MIRIEVNNVRTKFIGDRKILNKLYNELSFKHPNAYFIQKKIKYAWDGMVHPMDSKGFIKTGLLEYCVNKLIDYGVEEFELVDYRSFPKLKEIPNTLGGLELRGYQYEAIRDFVTHSVGGIFHPRGIFLMGMGAGKTLIMMAIHSAFKDSRSLLLVNSRILFDQLKGDLIKVFGSDAGWVQGKRAKWGKITVAMVQTLNSRLEEYREELLKFNILLVDEADSMVNKTAERVMAHLGHIGIRAGFTGTAFLRNLAKDRLINTNIREVFGDVIREITMGELEAMKFNTKTRIKIIDIPYSGVSYKDYPSEWSKEVTFNSFVHSTILKRVKFNRYIGRKHILIFVKYIQQAEVLYEYLKDKISCELDFIHHKRVGDRLEKFRDGNLPVLITTTFAKRGLNLPKTDCIINVSGGDWYANPLQILGRGVRLDENKEDTIYEDFYFNSPYLKSHSGQRIKYYKKVGLEIVRVIHLRG